MEAYDKIKKTLAVAFMHDLDNNRPEGKMCLSNGECADIEKAFNEQDWPKLARYLDKYTDSEDERIRKDILRFLKAKIENCTSPTSAKSTLSMRVSYLERQKERNEDVPLQPIIYTEQGEVLAWQKPISQEDFDKAD